MEDELEGFYVSSYSHSGRKGKQYLLTTHFEPTLARTAFPCFDEPAMKATFRLRLLHQPNYTVFFNTEIVDTQTVQLEGGHLKTLSTSETTVPMSTYLVAFVVCDFAVSSVKNDDSSTGGIVVRTVVPEEQNAHTAYALQFGSKVITFFQKFFKVDYPLRKLDMVAVPDFSAGAMENWGIITFRTTTLLYNERESSSEMQEQVATVICE
ncbi:PREDICTED: endoplasmic reticulum aminopeptidase 2-like [Rhagoletis zephyria]|uniref:endoplasmic reticulum aminopeptidase 2-like n=1 Tax=Rhagoletis zephyria TaxID=28612 RepID=UPI00081158D6|nr:PREDICTED: endoplasmic reticulum aminopeptidase 2-like [Rhagoletis zephyria]